MATTPAERLERLRRHALAGLARARADERVRARASRWLEAHPAAMPHVDDLWQQALAGAGPLTEWVDAGGRVDDWRGEVALHSVLACHPFPDLPQWIQTRP